MVAAGPAQIAADLPGAPGDRGQAGEAGQAVGAGESGQVAAGRGDELGAEGGPHAWQGEDDLGVAVVAEAGFALNAVTYEDYQQAKKQLAGKKAATG
ncbi:hypothetical protein SUDANB180_00063 [Streptomyces sp. enrichment culture]